MAERRIWPTNNIVDLQQVADAFGLPGELKDVATATQSVEEVLTEILRAVKASVVGIAMLLEVDPDELYRDEE